MRPGEHYRRFSTDGNVTLIARHTIPAVTLSLRTMLRIACQGTMKADETVANHVNIRHTTGFRQVRAHIACAEWHFRDELESDTHHLLSEGAQQ
jgi:hypothetical protein